jgi:hypothetical protein
VGKQRENCREIIGFFVLFFGIISSSVNIKQEY